MKLKNHLVFGTILVTLSANANALDMVQEIDACTQISSDQARLECFDSLSSEISAIRAASANERIANSELSTEPADSDSSSSDTMPKAIGGRQFASEEELNEPLTTGQVTFCERSYDQKYLFIFASGQVWKQSNSKKYRLKDCGFDVTISKDFFGYFMQIEGEAYNRTGKIRINRIK